MVGIFCTAFDLVISELLTLTAFGLAIFLLSPTSNMASLFLFLTGQRLRFA